MRKMSEEPVCTGFTDIHNHRQVWKCCKWRMKMV